MYLPIYPVPFSIQEAEAVYHPEPNALLRLSAGDLSADSIEEIKGLWNRFTSETGQLVISEDNRLTAHTACMGNFTLR